MIDLSKLWCMFKGMMLEIERDYVNGFAIHWHESAMDLHDKQS